MKKLTKQGLSDLAKTMPIVLKEELSMCIGCGDGSAENPYTQFEFNCFLDSGSWHGGYVEGAGYVSAEAVVSGNLPTTGLFGSHYIGSTSDKVLAINPNPVHATHAAAREHDLAYKELNLSGSSGTFDPNLE